MDEQQRIISTLCPLWESPKEMKWTRESHADNLAQKTASMFLNEHLSDVILLADDSENGFPCHRIVLTTGCRYFQKMFASKFQEATLSRIIIIGIQHHVLKSILHYLYIGNVGINIDNVQGLLHASDMMLLDSLKQGCIEFYQQFISTENCLGIWQVSDQCNATVLKEQALNYALLEFSSVYKTTEFTELNADCLGFYLEHADLNVEREEDICLAFVLWLNHDSQNRSVHLMSILPKMRLALQAPLVIKDLLLSNPAITQSKEASSFLEGIMNHLNYHSILPNAFQLQPIRTHGNVPSTSVIIGGFVDSRRSKICQAVRYEEQSAKPSVGTAEITELPSVYNIEMACCVLKNIIYICGAGVEADEIWSLDVSRMYWIKCSQMNHGRICHAMVPYSSNNKIFIIGGYNQSTDTVLSNIEEYDLQRNTTASVGDLKNAVACCTAQLILSKIYTFGGASQDERPTACIQMFNTITRDVTLLPIKLPTAALRLKSHVCKDVIIAIGMNEGFIVDLRKLYEVSSNDVVKQDDKPPAEDLHKSVIKQVGGIGKDLFGLELLGDKLLVMGGRCNENDSDLVPTVEMISVSKFLENERPKWSPAGTLLSPAAVYMSSLVFMKNKLAMDNQVTAF